MNRIDPERLHLLLAYNPETGALSWKSRAADTFTATTEGRAKRAAAIWESTKAGKPAGTIGKSGRVMVFVDRKPLIAARLIWAMMKGEWPTGVIDHINGDPSDDRIINLRDVSLTINNRNQRMSSRNTSGYSGVCLHRRSGLWQARITLNNKPKTLGYFKTKEEAAQAREVANRENAFSARHGK